MNQPGKGTSAKPQPTELEPGVPHRRLENQLTRLLESPTFSGSARLRRFLEYTVSTTLRGEAGRIKEYVLGREVFDRNDSYDPRIDPIVRVEAGRLRAKLEEYYTTYGKNDSVVIRYPKGSYVPSFETRQFERPASGDAEPFKAPSKARKALVAAAVLTVALAGLGVGWRAATHSPERADRGETGTAAIPLSTIAVLPLENLSEEPESHLAEAVTEALITELSKIKGLEVRSRTTVRHYKTSGRPARELGRQLAVGSILEGAVIQVANQVHVKVRLIDATRDTKLWAESYTCRKSEVLGLQAEVARSIAQAIAHREGLERRMP